MEEKVETRGGYRQNSGRKKIGNVPVCFRLPKDIVDRLRLEAKEAGVTIGEIVTRYIAK